MKNRINDLGSTLKICVINVKKLEAIFPKGKIQGKHISYAHIKHDHNAYHHHAFINSKVYTCTYRDCKGYLAKFCYSKLNLKAKNV